MSAIDHIAPFIFHKSLVGIWGPILLLAIPPAIKTKSWKSIFRSLLWVSFGIVVPVGWFLLSTGLLAEWKGGCRFGAWDCFVVGKLWLSPLVLWALAALYVRVIWKAENPTQRWIVLGYWTGAVVSTICLIHGLIVYTEGLLQIWPFSVPIAVSAYYIIVSRRLLAANQISWSELIGTLLGGVPLWAASVWQSLRTYSILPEQAPECFVVTAASRGHPWLVGPHQMIQRYQVEREVNKQLVTFWRLEGAWHTASPMSHRMFRCVYNRIGPAVARRIRHPLLADVAFLALKPFEWIARIILWISQNLHSNR